MIFKQIHTLPTNPNWGKIALITLATIGAGIIVYQFTKPDKLKIDLPTKKDHKTH